MKLFVQRIKVCLRLARTLWRLWREGVITPAQMLKIRKRGNGLASTFLIDTAVVIKVRNEMASAGNRALYNGRFDGLFAYAGDAERFRKEFDIYSLLAEKGLSARPVLLADDALVTRFITTKGSLIENDRLPAAHIALILNMIEQLHKDGLFHGDLNLDNFILQDDKLFVIDFESSRHIGEDERDSLPALDLIIFLEKFHRFHPQAFTASIPALAEAIRHRNLASVEAKAMAQKYLPAEAAAQLF